MKSTKLVNPDEFPNGVYKSFILDIKQDENNPDEFKLYSKNYSNITNLLVSNDQEDKYFTSSPTVINITDLREFRKPKDILKRPFPVQRKIPENWVEYLQKQVELRGKNKLANILEYEDDFSHNDLKEFNRVRSPDNIQDIKIPTAKPISNHELYYEARDCDLFMLKTYIPNPIPPSTEPPTLTGINGCPNGIPNCPNHPSDPNLPEGRYEIPNPNYVPPPWYELPEYEAWKYYNTRKISKTNKYSSIICYLEIESYVTQLKNERLSKLYNHEIELENIKKQINFEKLKLDHYPIWDIENKVLENEYENIIIPAANLVDFDLGLLLLGLEGISIENLQKEIDKKSQELFILYLKIDETNPHKLEINHDYNIEKIFQTIRICQLNKLINLDKIFKLQQEKINLINDDKKFDLITKQIQELEEDNLIQEQNKEKEINKIKNVIIEANKTLNQLKYYIQNYQTYINTTLSRITNLENKIPPLEDKINEIKEDIKINPNCETIIYQDVVLKNKVISPSVFIYFTPNCDVEFLDRPKAMIFLNILRKYINLIYTFYVFDYNDFMELSRNTERWLNNHQNTNYPYLDQINGQCVYGFAEKEVQPFFYLTGRFYPSVIYIKTIIRENTKAYCIAYGPDGRLYISLINPEYYKHLYDIL